MFLKGKLDEMSAKLAAVEKESENQRRENVQLDEMSAKLAAVEKESESERIENVQMKVCTFRTVLY